MIPVKWWQNETAFGRVLGEVCRAKSCGEEDMRRTSEEMNNIRNEREIGVLHEREHACVVSACETRKKPSIWKEEQLREVLCVCQTCRRGKAWAKRSELCEFEKDMCLK